MSSTFFIKRPVFASVLSILIFLAGLFAIGPLPIEQYPNITPPQVLVYASYPGADALTVASSLAAPLEKQINGVENMIYMYSQNSANGDMALNIYFDIGTDPDFAQINVQNRVNMAMPQLPEQVRRTGVIVKKQSPSILIFVAMNSPDNRYDNIFISNYASINVVDELLRLNGVSDVKIINARDYSIRVWLRPDRLAELSLTSQDVVNAIRSQNTDFTGGQLGRPPSDHPIELTIPITGLGKLSTPEQFENIILKANLDGSAVKIKDIGWVELGAQTYDVNGSVDGKETTMIGIYQQFGANALDVAERVRMRMHELSKDFPEGITYSIPYDTTVFINASIKEVIKTIFEAAVLVALVVLIFLQSWRATLIPVIAMIISIVGTFAGMYVLGFSINTLTLFGMVLAIGIVVDDAIVVIENVERNIREFHLSSKDAAIKAMEEVSGPVIAIVFVLCAVFIPVAFLGGIAGQLYRQFAITIAVSVTISGIVALTLSPALAALILKKPSSESTFARYFNRAFNSLTNDYVSVTKWILNHTWFGLLTFGLIIVALIILAKTAPTSFIPSEDQGYVIAVANLPDSASLQRSQRVDNIIEKIASKEPGVKQVVSLTGFSLLDGINQINRGTSFITLKNWSDRTTSDLQAGSILTSLNQKFWGIPEAQIFGFNPPAIHGLGIVSGFEFWIENRSEASIDTLKEITQKFIQEASKYPELQNVNSTIQADNLQLYVDLDRYKAESLGVPINEIFDTLQIYLGSYYVNDFTKFGRSFRVTIQADPNYRSSINNLSDIYIRSTTNQMIPFKSLLSTEFSRGPNLISRFNGFNSAKIMGNAALGYSSGQAMAIVEKIAKDVLPEGMSYSWSGESYQEKSTGGTSSKVLLVGIFMVFLILAALYERWSLPFSIILAIPLGLLGAFIAIWLRKMMNDVYFEIGLVTLVALAAKNAILIVEFAIIKRKEGLSIMEATLEASKLRFRAIIMTSLTFILGVVPLVISSGAGASSRQSVGTGVFGGMITATFFAVFLVPLFFKLIEERTSRSDKQETPHEKQ